MATHPRIPRTLRGAIVAIDVATRARSTIVFEYNPETLKRSLKPQTVGGETNQHSHAMRFTGAPVETIDVEVMIDASDQLEAGERNASEMGIHAQLAALEMLLYPQSETVINNSRLLEQGIIEVGPYVAPLAILIWGGRRVLPVNLTSYSSHEELFDARLNPIRATISMSLRALTYSELDPSHPGYHLFLAHQQGKEAMSRLGFSGDASSAIGVDVSRI